MWYAKMCDVSVYNKLCDITVLNVKDKTSEALLTLCWILTVLWLIPLTGNYLPPWTWVLLFVCAVHCYTAESITAQNRKWGAASGSLVLDKMAAVAMRHYMSPCVVTDADDITIAFSCSMSMLVIHLSNSFFNITFGKKESIAVWFDTYHSVNWTFERLPLAFHKDIIFCSLSARSLVC